MKSVLEVLKATTGYFEKHGVETARLNIEHLLAHVLKIKRMDLYMQFDRPLSDQELEPLRDLVRRRAAGEPLQHLLGTVDFMGRIFASDKRALIPRPETEELCEKILAEYPKPAFPARVLDIGTGSGIIALTLAAEWPEAAVEAVDVSEAALTLAKENATRLELAGRTRIYQSDLFASVTGPFDLVAANLPYIARSELAGLSREVRHDPVSALDGGERGDELLFRLIAEALPHLRGLLALEIGHDQSQRLCDYLAKNNYHDIRPFTDYQGRNRFVFAKYG